MLGLKLNHVSKRGHMWHHNDNIRTKIKRTKSINFSWASYEVSIGRPVPNCTFNCMKCIKTKCAIITVGYFPISCRKSTCHDDIMTWEQFLHYWHSLFIHQSLVDYTPQGILMWSFDEFGVVGLNKQLGSRDGDFRRYVAHVTSVKYVTEWSITFRGLYCSFRSFVLFRYFILSQTF